MNGHLVIGASGQVGEHLMRCLQGAGYPAAGTYYPDPRPGLLPLDIRDQRTVAVLLDQIRPEIVYLPAALTNVDYCELHPDESYVTNVLGTCHVAREVERIGAKLVFFSSDYVFDGLDGPYAESDPVHPICEYGRQKVLGEHYIALNVSNFLIVRTTVVYGWESQGKNFVYRLLNALKDGQILKVPADQIGNPTYASNLARAVIELSRSDESGVYHIVGPERVSRYEFACEAARVFGLDENLIQPVSTSELQQPALRPLSAGMVVGKITAKQTLFLMGYREGLRGMKSERSVLIDKT